MAQVGGVQVSETHQPFVLTFGILNFFNGTVFHNQESVLYAFESEISIVDCFISDSILTSSLLFYIGTKSTISNIEIRNVSSTASNTLVSANFASELDINNILFKDVTNFGLWFSSSSVVANTLDFTNCILSFQALSFISAYGVSLENITFTNSSGSFQALLQFRNSAVDLVKGLSVQNIEATLVSVENSQVTQMENLYLGNATK